MCWAMCWIRVVALIAAWGIAVVPAWATEYIDRDAWPTIQRGIQVTQFAPLVNVVNEFDRAPESSLVILYPGGEAGQAWATEIRDWLVALGIPGRRIALRPGSGVPGSLGLQVEQQSFK